MCTDRRKFLRLSAGMAGATLLSGTIARGDNIESYEAESPYEPLPQQQREVPESIRKLKRMTDGIVPITLDDRKGRIEKSSTADERK